MPSNCSCVCDFSCRHPSDVQISKKAVNSLCDQVSSQMNLIVSVLLHASQLAAGQMLHTPPKDWTELKQPEGKKSSGEVCLFSVHSEV